MLGLQALALQHDLHLRRDDGAAQGAARSVRRAAPLLAYRGGRRPDPGWDAAAGGPRD